MPAINPLISSFDGGPVDYTPGIEALITQNPVPAAASAPMNTGAMTSPTQINAAGTSEHVNRHVAAIVILAGLGAWGLNKIGFKFAAAGSVGIGR